MKKLPFSDHVDTLPRPWAIGTACRHDARSMTHPYPPAVHRNPSAPSEGQITSAQVRWNNPANSSHVYSNLFVLITSMDGGGDGGGFRIDPEPAIIAELLYEPV